MSSWGGRCEGVLLGLAMLAVAGCPRGSQRAVVEGEPVASEASTGWALEGQETPVVSLPDTSGERRKGFGVVQLNLAETGLSLAALQEGETGR